MATIIRSRTAQAKKDESESRNLRTDASASPERDNATSARETSRSDTAATDNAANAVGTSRGSAASATKVFAATECLRSSNHTGSSALTVALPARGSTPPAKAARSLVSHA